MIVGTAGHVDHGKSALIEALTGRPMDRLAEERRRGLTIELNFAPLDLGGHEAGVVDVPGHEDLVRTMAAGAWGMDVVLLVVAADEGIRPQTREHRAVLEALRVPRGLPVVTRADLVAPDVAAGVAEEVAAWLADSPVAFGPPLVVSARTGLGLEALRRRLAVLAGEGDPAARAGDLFRLAVDRVFQVPGAGTVVTGSVVSGTVRVGDRLLVMPGGGPARVRAIEAFGRQVEVGTAGQRVGVALALHGTEVARGQVLVGDGAGWRETSAIDARLELAPGTPEPAHGARVRVLTGTAERLARVRRRADAPGIVRLALEEPAVVRGGDRFVLRSYSPLATLGGGVVLDPAPPARAPWPATLADPDPGRRLTALAARRPDGIAPGELPVLTGRPPGQAGEVVRAAGLVAHGGRQLAPEVVERAREAVLAAVNGAEAVPLASLRALPRHSRTALGAALEALEREGRLSSRQGLVRTGEWPDTLPPEVLALAVRVEAAGLSAPTAQELGGSPADLRAAEAAGLVVRVDRERWLGASAARRLHSVLRELAETGEITPGRLRERTGLSRKYLIPLLELSDREGWTSRRGGERVPGPRLA